VSVWYTDIKKENVEFSDDKTEFDVLFKNDRDGNHYVSIPIEFIIDLLSANKNNNAEIIK